MKMKDVLKEAYDTKEGKFSLLLLLGGIAALVVLTVFFKDAKSLNFYAIAASFLCLYASSSFARIINAIQMRESQNNEEKDSEHDEE